MVQITSILFATLAATAFAQDTLVTITEGLTTTMTLPAFPSPTSTETVTETSLIISGMETTTTTELLDLATILPVAPTASVTASVTATVINATVTAIILPTEVNTAAQSSYISSLLSEAQSLTSTLAISTVTAQTTLVVAVNSTATVLSTGTGVGAPVETFTGAASSLNAIPAMGLVAAAIMAFF